MRLLFGCIFIDLLGFGIIIPLLPFMALQLGADAQEVTLLIAAYSLSQLIMLPVWGRLSDKWGRRPVLLISFAGTTTAFFLLAFADALWMLFLARILAGGLSGDLAAAPAYVSDITTPEKRAKGMGMIGAAFALAFVFGPAIGAALSGNDPATADYRLPSLLAACLSICVFFVALFFLPESRRKDVAPAPPTPATATLRHLLAQLTYPHLVHITAILFLVGVVFSSMEATLALWTNEVLSWGPQQVGYLFVYAGIVAIIFQAGLVGPFTRRFGEPRVVVGASILLGVGMLVVALAEGLPLLLLAVGCLAAGFGLGHPSLQSLISRLSGEGRTGGALGLGQATSSLARVIGSAWSGWLFQGFGQSWPYIAGACLMVVAVGLAERLRRRVPASLLARGAPAE